MHSIGASFAASAPFVPRWSEGYNNGRSVGGLLHAVLSPLGVFGDILTVMIALTIPSACTLSMYSCCTSFMTVSSVFAKIPRNVYSIISTAM
jgi:purine-cytosine permease-like protein